VHARAGVFAATLISFSSSCWAAPDRAREEELLYLLRQDCGSCHGMTMRGGLGPALTPEALSEKPDAYLVHSILEGRPGTAMPPWKRFLSQDEAQWLVDSLRHPRD
jgi:cytochrome c55X